jgi:ribosomal protein S18 acetylase RimI-like enzyme
MYRIKQAGPMVGKINELFLSSKPVTKDNWDDFKNLFESKGAPKYCWCTVWRLSSKEKKDKKADRKKTHMCERVMKGIPIGILAYYNESPIGWCSIAPRNSFYGLGGNENIDNVWSVTCFYIKREYRHSGVQKYLLKEGIRYTQLKGAEYVEAYPVLKDSPSYRFMGITNLFEEYGFQFIKMAGSRRHVMNLKITRE